MPGTLASSGTKLNAIVMGRDFLRENKSTQSGVLSASEAVEG